MLLIVRQCVLFLSFVINLAARVTSRRISDALGRSYKTRGRVCTMFSCETSSSPTFFAAARSPSLWMMSQVLAPLPHLDVPKCIPDYVSHHKVASSPSFFTSLGNLVPVATSPIHSDSPSGSVDDNISSPSSRSSGPPPYAPRPSAAFDSPLTSPTTDMFDLNSRPSFVAAQYPSGSQSLNNASDTLKNSDAVGSYLSESPSPVDVHRPSSLLQPLSAPPSQERFPLTGAPSYSGDDRTLTDRCNRQSPNDKYSNSCSQANLEQRRMSEPNIMGNASAYAPSSDSCDRLPQYPFAFNPSQSARSSTYMPTLPRGSSVASLRDLRHSDYSLSQSQWKHHDDVYENGLYEPISPLNPNFPSGLLSSPGVHYSPGGGDPYGPSPPNTATSTSSAPPLGSLGYSSFGSHSQLPHMQRGPSLHPSFTGDANSKTYSFVALPGNTVKKRPRRRYDEIERLYQCSWPDCNKSYGTLNHLNAHVTMQKHGPKRTPNG
jgi:hypothetical protein